MEGSGAAAYNQGDATGFIRLNALRLKVRAAVAKAGEESSLS
jgi:argininosuccinate synthase